MGEGKGGGNAPALTVALPPEAGLTRNRKWPGRVGGLRRILRGWDTFRPNHRGNGIPRRKA
jgi:hypothetical protein